MPTMNVNLTPEMAEFVAEEVASGDYASASELVRDALRILRRDRDIEKEKDAWLRKKLANGQTSYKPAYLLTVFVTVAFWTGLACWLWYNPSPVMKISAVASNAPAIAAAARSALTFKP